MYGDLKRIPTSYCRRFRGGSGVEEVNGLPFETYKGIIMAGGAGANPTDTMITMIDSSKTPPKAIILHTSNKTSTADIQSNSSPEKI